MNSVGAPGADSAETRLPTRIIICAWGEKYLNELLSIVVPSLLAVGNLPFVASEVPTELVILTEEKYFTRVSGDPRIARIRKFCPIRLIGVDDLVSNPHVYGKSLTYALHRGLADLGAEMVNTWHIFLNADFVLAEGSLQNVLPRLIRGSRIVAAPSYCVVAEDVTPIIEARIDLTDGTLSIPSREMARLALDYRHNTVRANTVNDRRFHARYVTQFYWEVDEDTLVGHQMPVAIVAMRPERYVREPNSYWDQGLMKEFCPESRVDIIGDSDEFLMIELREREVAKDTMLPGPGEPSVLARDMLGMRTLYQLDFAFQPLTLHAEDLPPTLEDARRSLRGHVELVLSHLSKHLPSHINHPQWNYHHRAFLEHRYQFLSEKLGAITLMSEPPEQSFELDRLWWKLDGLRKAYKLRCAELLREISSPAADIPNARRPTLNKLYPIHCLSAPEATLPDQTDARGAWDEIATRKGYEYASSEVRFRDERSELLDQKLAQAILRLEEQYAAAVSEYGRSWVVPLVRTRRGKSSADAAAISIKSPIGLLRCIPRILSRTFGLTSTNRRCQTQLVDLIRDAVSRGAEDILFIGERSIVNDHFVGLPGLHAWVSTSDMKSNNFAKVFETPPKFDLCICDLDLDEFAEFTTIFESVLPFMRQGGTIVGLHLNPENADLSVDYEGISVRLAHIPNLEIFHTSFCRTIKENNGWFLPIRCDRLVGGAICVRLEGLIGRDPS
jgi:hypothetical protein